MRQISVQKESLWAYFYERQGNFPRAYVRVGAVYDPMRDYLDRVEDFIVIHVYPLEANPVPSDLREMTLPKFLQLIAESKLRELYVIPH